MVQPWSVWLSWLAKGRRFDSWLGHMPQLQVRSLVGVHIRGNQLMFLSLSSSLLLS